MLDTGDNPDAPAPREMIDLEVPVPLEFWCLQNIMYISVYFEIK